jgi:hypothetical protein
MCEELRELILEAAGTGRGNQSAVLALFGSHGIAAPDFDWRAWQDDGQLVPGCVRDAFPAMREMAETLLALWPRYRHEQVEEVTAEQLLEAAASAQQHWWRWSAIVCRARDAFGYTEFNGTRYPMFGGECACMGNGHGPLCSCAMRMLNAELLAIKVLGG